MRLKIHILVPALILGAASCQKSIPTEFVSDLVVDVDKEVLAWTVDQNKWIFTNMKRQYFWTDQLKDSLAYDYSLEPGLFFESMLVEEDRFSYCERNEDYVGTKSFNLNETVYADTVFRRGSKTIGYIRYKGFGTEADVTDVFLKMQGINELVLDLRDNPGGYVRTGIYLASLIVPRTDMGKLFCTYRYNKNYQDTYSYFDKTGKASNWNLDLKRVFILVTPNSASCSELLINSLRPYMTVVVIGETTRGKDVGMTAISGMYYKYRLYPITFRTYNANGEAVPTTGLIPDIPVKNTKPALSADLNEPMFNCAVNYIINNQ